MNFVVELEVRLAFACCVMARHTFVGALKLVEVAFAHAGLDWNKHVHLDPKLIRPAEVEHLVGDASKARTHLGWKPTVDFAGLIKMMVDADLERVTAAPHANMDHAPIL